jgi:hypothetical protein
VLKSKKKAGGYISDLLLNVFSSANCTDYNQLQPLPAFLAGFFSGTVTALSLFSLAPLRLLLLSSSAGFVSGSSSVIATFSGVLLGPLPAGFSILSVLTALFLSAPQPLLPATLTPPPMVRRLATPTPASSFLSSLVSIIPPVFA